MKIIMEFALLGKELLIPGDLPEGAELAVPDPTPNPQEIIALDMPRGSQIIGVHFNQIAQLMLVATADPEAKTSERRFVVLKQGDALPERIVLSYGPHPATTVFVGSPQKSRADGAVYVFEIVPR